MKAKTTARPSRDSAPSKCSIERFADALDAFIDALHRHENGDAELDDDAIETLAGAAVAAGLATSCEQEAADLRRVLELRQTNRLASAA